MQNSNIVDQVQPEIVTPEDASLSTPLAGYIMVTAEHNYYVRNDVWKAVVRRSKARQEQAVRRHRSVRNDRVNARFNHVKSV